MPFTPEEPFDNHGRSPATQCFDEARRLMEGEAFAEAADLLHQAAIESSHFKTYELMGECDMKTSKAVEATPASALGSASRFTPSARRASPYR
jgi:hypothetical protein